jgi:hypothetical protein
VLHDKESYPEYTADGGAAKFTPRGGGG